MRYLLYLLVGFSAFTPVMGQVEIAEQKFDYTHFTYDITLYNKGSKDVMLTEISAAYKVYIYTLWLGVGDPPRIKTTAVFTLPLYLAPECLDTSHLTSEITRKTHTEGFWECNSSILSNPALLVPSNGKVRFQVQLEPVGYKAYWEMEVDLQLALHFDNGLITKPVNTKILSEDIMGYFLADRILKKEKILRILENKDEQEFINLRSGRGKLEYSFDKAVATCHLDKIGLSPDSLRIWLRLLLKDKDFGVRMAACKMIRKYQMIDMIEEVRNAGESTSMGVFYTLVTLGDTGYIHTSPEVFFTEPGKYEHLANTLDEPFYKKVIDLLSSHRDVFGDQRLDESSFFEYLTKYEHAEAEFILRNVLTHETNESVLNSIISGLYKKTLGKGQNDFIKKFVIQYKILWESEKKLSQDELLGLICYTEDDLTYIEKQIKKALISHEQSTRQFAFQLMPAIEKRKTPFPDKSTHWLWELYYLYNHKSTSQEIFTRFTDNLCSTSFLERSTPEDALMVVSLIEESNLFSYNFQHQKKEQVFTVICQPDYLEKLTLHHLALLATFLNPGSDSIHFRNTETVIKKCLNAKKIKDTPPKALLEIAEALTIKATSLKHNSEDGAKWYGFVATCYEAIPKTYQNAAWSASGFFSELAWLELESQRAEQALAAAKRGMAWQERQVTTINYATSLLMAGHFKEAQAIYGKLKNEVISEPEWYSGRPVKEVLLEKLNELERRKVIPEGRIKDVAAIRALLAKRA